ncbi:MAG: hypothetical protein IJW55_05505 [Clostridia bacterium]|nr:hypothetical protein [Clostridia bacterium]
MLYPTIEDLTQGKYNRYELALATAKCARLITNEYVRQHEIAEKAGTKEAHAAIDRELRDDKAVKVAISRMYRGEYRIDPHVNETVGEEVADEVVLAEETEVTDEAVGEPADEQ